MCNGTCVEVINQKTGATKRYHYEYGEINSVLHRYVESSKTNFCTYMIWNKRIQHLVWKGKSQRVRKNKY